MLLALTILLALGQDPPQPSARKPSILGRASVSKTANETDGSPKARIRAHLRLGDSFEAMIPASPSLEKFELLIKAARDPDQAVVQKVVEDPLIWGIENFVAIEVVNEETGNDLVAKVKLLDGAFENRTAFVARSSVSQGPPPIEPFPDNGFSFKDKRKILAAWLRMSSLENKKDKGAGFKDAQDALFRRFKITQDKMKAIMVELLAKQAQIGESLVENNPEADQYVVNPSPDMIPDPKYDPKIGDVAHLYSEGIYNEGLAPGRHLPVIICSDYSAFEAFERALAAEDDERLRNLNERGKSTPLKTGTRVRVLGFRYFSDDREVRNAIETRVLDGPLAGKKAWVPSGSVKRLVPKLIEPSRELIPDMDYVPKVGDEACLYIGAIFKDGPRAGEHMEVFGCIDYATFASHEKALLAKDNEGLAEFDSQGRRVYFRTGTQIEILGFRASSGDVGIRDASEVRLLDGPRKGEKVWVLASRIVRLIPKGDVSP